MKPFFHLSLSLLCLITFFGCPATEDDVDPIFQVPDDYTFTRDGQSTVSFGGQTTRIAMAEEFIAALLDPSNTVTDLNNMFTNAEGTEPFSDAALNASDKSIRSKVAASRDLFFTNATVAAEIKGDFDGWIEAQTTEVFPNWNELAAAGQAGQVADGSSTRYVNAWGLEYNQAIAKSLIGALMYDQLANNYLSTDILDENTNRTDNDLGTTEDGKNYTTMEHKWDEAFGYLFGASTTPATPKADLGDADNFLNKYVGRVEADPDFTGVANALELDYRLGRSAIVAGEYEERDARANRIKEILREVLVIRSIYYLKQAENTLTNNGTNPSLAFHDLSEAYGFIYSLRFIQAFAGDQALDFTAFSDEILADLRNADGNGFWDLAPATLGQRAQDIGDLFLVNVEQAGN